jgi:hypothetical protein
MPCRVVGGRFRCRRQISVVDIFSHFYNIMIEINDYGFFGSSLVVLLDDR